jgi:20S proteasome subunit alpha 2
MRVGKVVQLTIIGIVGPPEDKLLGYEGVEGAVGPRFRQLSPQEVEDYLTNL